MKRTVILIMAALLLLITAGCGQDRSNTEQLSGQSSPKDSYDDSADSRQGASEEESDSKALPRFSRTAEIVDKNGRHIGEIAENGMATMTDSGIFYSTANLEGTGTEPIGAGVPEGAKETYTYYLYDPRTNEHFCFGTVADQDYEAGYVRTELNGKLYTIITTGDALDNIADPLLLLEFDLQAHSVSQYKISDNGFPYTAMTQVGGKLLILNHDQTDKLHDKLYLFDPDSREIKQVLQFELSDNKGDTIRSVYSDQKHIYLLRLRFIGDNQVKPFLDTYDLSFAKQSEKDVSSMFDAGSDDFMALEDIVNEMKQAVSRFMVLNEGYVYYENFSTTRFLGRMEDGTVFDEPKGTGDLFAASSGSGKPFFCYIFRGGKNENAVFEWNNGSLSKTVFKADDDRYYITAASVSPNGKRLIQVEYANPNDRNDTLPKKLYCF